MSFSCGRHGWQHILKACPTCQIMFQKTGGVARDAEPALARGTATGWMHTGQCQEGCNCDFAKIKKAVSIPMTYKPDNHIVGKVYDLTQANMNAMIAHIEQLEAGLKHEKNRRALLVKAIKFGTQKGKRDSNHGG